MVLAKNFDEIYSLYKLSLKVIYDLIPVLKLLYA